MKRFITPENLASGQRLLRIQLEGATWDAFLRLIHQPEPVGISIPKGQSVKASWFLVVKFSDGSHAQFSSACTAIARLQEIGSLNIKIMSAAELSCYEI